MNKIYRLFLLSTLIILLGTTVRAAHIIGGVMTYRCTAPGKYTITMKVYRDCQGGGAEFDSRGSNSIIGTVSVYNGSLLYERYASINLSSPQVSTVQPTENPCLIVPPNVCVEEGVYTFDLDLPESDRNYTIVYQRCCRNGSISNILNPGGVGATYFVEITPESQAVCNSSPVFDDFPPIVICNNEELIYDHSASDATPGSQLVYSLCAPFVGGGTAGLSGDIAAQKSPNGIAPDPDVPPPYETVDYRQPTYSFDAPLNASPRLSINPNTGVMRGRPNAVGQYVVGVCVQEFVNGVLMSEIRRDFQFNVANCERRVYADLEADETLDDGTFVIRSCGENTMSFVNNSTNVNFIDDYLWTFMIDGNETTFDSRDVTITFPDTGVYQATMLLNPNSEIGRCRDSANLEIGVFGAISSDFDFDYDTCVAGPVAFDEEAFTENDRIVDYNWFFADGDSSSMTNPTHTYMAPGEYNPTLEVIDNRGCRAVVTKPLSYFPVPSVVVAEPDRFVGCNPLTVTFNNLSEPINEEYIINWDFGDGNTGEGLTVEHTFEDAGNYSVGVDIISPLGCEISDEFRNWIFVKESPDAAFSYTPEELNDLQREVFFTNESSGADGYQWQFGDGSADFVESPTYEYADTGIFNVLLIALSNNGCTDTATAVIDVAPLTTYYLPNAFSPNGDGLNDTYGGKGILKGIRSFNMTIWNRWGELVYESDDPAAQWDGLTREDGKPAPKGVYHCQVDYVGARGENFSVESSVTLLR